MVAKRWQLLQGHPPTPANTEAIVTNHLIHHLSF